MAIKILQAKLLDNLIDITAGNPGSIGINPIDKYLNVRRFPLG
jgi:hypothetical protein